MDPKEITKQLLDFNRTAFNNGFKAMVLLQNQVERVAQTTLSQSAWLPEEGRKAINDWMDAYTSGRDNFKALIDESYQKMEPFFTN